MTPIEWLLGNDTGTSSETICAVMTGSDLDGSFDGDVPHDSDDFGRCYRLLKHFPEWRHRLPEVGFRFPLWQPMVTAWDELITLFEQFCDEYGKVSGQSYYSNEAVVKRFNLRIRELGDDCLRADGWKEVSPGSWQRHDEQIVRMGG